MSIATATLIRKPPIPSQTKADWGELDLAGGTRLTVKHQPEARLDRQSHSVRFLGSRLHYSAGAAAGSPHSLRTGCNDARIRHYRVSVLSHCLVDSGNSSQAGNPASEPRVTGNPNYLSAW
jgi:hypothetical protein